MFILDAWKLYSLKKVEAKISKLKQKRDSLIEGLASINMLPAKYSNEEEPTYNPKNQSFFGEVSNNQHIVESTGSINETSEENVVAIHSESTDNSSDDITCIGSIEVRIVSTNEEKETVFIQKCTKADEQLFEPNLLPIQGVDKINLIPVGEHAILHVYSNKSVEFELRTGERIAC